MAVGNQTGASSEPVGTSQQDRARRYPEVSANMWSSIRQAPSWTAFGSDAPENLQDIFDSMYWESARAYYPDALDVKMDGEQVFKLFKTWKPVVDIFTRHALKGETDDPLQAFLNWDAQGQSEAVLRPLTADTFGNYDYYHTPTSTGEYEFLPNGADGDVETATANEQAWIIIGYADYSRNKKVPYDYIQEDVNDDVGVRRQIYTKHAMESHGTLKVLPRRRGPLMVPPGSTLDVDLNITEADIELGLRPVGFEVIRADASEFGGVQDS